MDPLFAYRRGVDEACKNILGSLEKDGVSRVILAGEAGIGKTWMARKICEHATKEWSFYIALWLNLNKEIDEMSLYEDIASQLYLFPDNDEEGEEDDSDEYGSEDEEEQKNRDLTMLKDQIHKKLWRKKLKREGKKNLLLVLDDEGSVTNEEKVMKELYLGVFLALHGPLKILLTRREREEDVIDSGGEIESEATDGEIQSHAMVESHLGFRTIDESQTLRDICTDDYLIGLLESLTKEDYLVNLLECLTKEESREKLPSLEESLGTNHEMLKHHIVRLSMRLPAALVVLAKSLNYVCHSPSCLASPYLQEVFKIAIDCERSNTGKLRENPILRLSYKLLQTDDTMKKSSAVDCFWHSLSFFEHCGCVYHQELIAHWILEGYFDPVTSVMKAFKAGRAVMMELIKRGFLKIQEENVVMPEVAMKELIDLRRCGLSGTSRIGLAKICGSNTTKGLGKINYVDDIIEGVRGTKKAAKLTTVLASGNRLMRISPEKYFEKLGDLEILGLFDPILDTFVSFLLKPEKLRVLVIRECNLLKDIEELKTLQGLHVLEVSGASSLKRISDDFFLEMHELQTLHLSGLQIKSSPSSICLLKKLHRLIIRNCPLLKDLPDIQELKNLEVVDISGAHGLQTCFDNTPGEKKNKSKNVNFHHLRQLQLLDLSESQIDMLPMFQDAEEAAKIHSLKRLLLRNCRKLVKLPNLKPLSGLQILDLSGTISLVKILEVCFEDKKELRSLNLSGANIRQLPSTIEELSNLDELLLRDCTNLESLPNIEKLTNLEVFDVCGCTKLHTIEGSFEDMSYMRDVNLSGTKVSIPPELPKETKLRCSKRITLADGSVFEGEIWSKITEAITIQMTGNPSSSEAVVKSQEIIENEPEETREIQPSETRTSKSTEEGGFTKERLLQVPIKRDIYKNILLHFDSASQQEVVEIHESRELHGEAAANAEFVSFVDINSTRLKSFFSETKSVKGCSLRMCRDMKDLFCEVDKESLGSLESLSITNFPSLETICWGGSFKNLKKLSIDCCPNIKTLFPEASQMPSSLEVLHIKYCEKLEKVFKEGEVSTLTTLCLYELPLLSAVGAKLPNLETFDKKMCPKLLVLKEHLEGWTVVDHSDASPED